MRRQRRRQDLKTSKVTPISGSPPSAQRIKAPLRVSGEQAGTLVACSGLLWALVVALTQLSSVDHVAGDKGFLPLRATS